MPFETQIRPTKTNTASFSYQKRLEAKRLQRAQDNEMRKAALLQEAASKLDLLLKDYYLITPVVVIDGN